jgi:hypothetical protein
VKLYDFWIHFKTSEFSESIPLCWYQIWIYKIPSNTTLFIKNKRIYFNHNSKNFIFYRFHSVVLIRIIMYWKIQSNTTYIDYGMIRLLVSTVKLPGKNNYIVFVLTWDPSVTDGMGTLGCYNRYYNFPILFLRFSGKSSSCTQHNTLKIQDELFPEYLRNKIGKL